MGQQTQKEEARKSTAAAPAEIDLLQLFGELKKHFLLLFIVAVLCGGIAVGVCKFLIAPTYESTSVLYVLTKETTLASLADLQIGTQLTADYKEIITSRPVLEKVIGNLGLNMTHSQLSGKLSIENPSSTRILRITAKDNDPEMAKKIADNVAEVAAEYIADIMEMVPPKSIEDGEVPVNKSSPETAKTALIAALLGVICVSGIICFDVIMDDSVKTAEDVQKYLNVPVLASIAYSESIDDHNQGKTRDKRKKKRETETTGGKKA